MTNQAKSSKQNQAMHKNQIKVHNQNGQFVSMSANAQRILITGENEQMKEVASKYKSPSQTMQTNINLVHSCKTLALKLSRKIGISDSNILERKIIDRLEALLDALDFDPKKSRVLDKLVKLWENGEAMEIKSDNPDILALVAKEKATNKTALQEHQTNKALAEASRALIDQLHRIKGFASQEINRLVYGIDALISALDLDMNEAELIADMVFVSKR